MRSLCRCPRFCEPQTREEGANEIRQLRTRRAALQMQLIQDKVEIQILQLQPSTCPIEDRRIDLTIEHGPQHADIGYQQVRR